MNHMLDACAVIAAARRERGAEVVRALLLDPASRCSIHAANLCEVYYDTLKIADEAAAEKVIADLKDMDVIITEDMDEPFWKEAAHLKFTLRKISLADCFAVVAARRADAEIVTADRREFEPVARQGICQVRFIR